MLVWEEDRTTETVHAASSAQRASTALRLAQPSAVEAAIIHQSLPAAPAAALAAVPAARRVKAADKRIINGRTDVNQLVPFKYKWAWE